MIARLALFLAASVLLGPAPSLAVPLQVGDILVTDPTGTLRVDPNTGVTSLFSPVGGTDITAGLGGVFLTSGNSVIHLDPGTGAANLVSSGGLLQILLALDVAPNGELFVLSRVAPPVSEVSVLRVNPTTGAQGLLAVVDTSGLGAEDLAVGLTGNLFVQTEFGVVFRVNISSGVVTSLGDLDHGHAIDVLPNGDLVIAHNSSIAAGSGQVIVSAHDVAVGPSGQVYFTGFTDFRGGGPILGVAHFAPSPQQGSFTVLAPDVSGRLTVFVTVPMPSTLFLLALGVGCLVGIGTWRRT